MSEGKVQRQYESNIGKALALFSENPVLMLKIGARKALTEAQPFPTFPTIKIIDGIHYAFDFNFDLVKANGQDEYTKGVLKAMYYGSYEPLTIAVMHRFLKPGSVFFDVGASIGYLSAVGAGLVGREGQVHCFEPVPQYFQNVALLAELNPDHMIVANQTAVGEVPGTFLMNVDTDIYCGSTMLANALSHTNIEVSVIRLDDYIRDHDVARVDLMHIEVEGFELPVLKGAQAYFERHRPPIICGIFPGYYPVQGYQLADLDAYMSGLRYQAHKLSQLSKPIKISELDEHTLVLFLPDE